MMLDWALVELYRTYATVYMGFAIVCFDVLYSQGIPHLVSLFVLVSMGFEGFTSSVGILESVLF